MAYGFAPILRVPTTTTATTSTSTIKRTTKISSLPRSDDEQDVSASPSPQTQRRRTVAPNTAAIQEYLSRNVKAIPLPELFHEDDHTYAPLILDGASGVGKTQQAFALLKTEKCQLIYLNLASDRVTLDSQPIYQEMRKLTKPEAIVRAITRAIKQVKAYTFDYENDSTDRFSEFALGRRVEAMFCSTNRELDGLKALVEELQKSKLEYKNRAIRKVPVKVELTYRTFNNVVLFIDEGLPQDPNDEDRLRLRLLVNLGRAMGMRVVVVANAEAAVNLIPKPEKREKQASRMGGGGNALAEIVFLWQAMEEETMDTILPESVLQKISLPATDLNRISSELYTVLKNAIRMERPSVAVYIRDVLTECSDKPEPVDWMTVLKSVGKKLEASKNRSKEEYLIWRNNHLVWLAGPFLDGVYKMPGAVRMQAHELVHGHFFEPCIAVDLEDQPLFIPWICGWKRRSSPLRLAIQGVVNKMTLLHSVTVQDDIDVPMRKTLDCGSFTSKGFGAVDSCFSNCVQQCLKREPLLAVALSTIQLSPSEFNNAIAMNRRQTFSFSQPKFRAVNGELYEQTFFAAVQLASHSSSSSTLELLDVVSFVKSLEPYIFDDDKETAIDEALRLNPSVQTRQLSKRGKLVWRNVKAKPQKRKGNKGPKLQNLDDDVKLTAQKVDDMKKQLCGYLIPWLVPASNGDDLLKSCKELFPDGMVAGLVPSEMNGRFDAHAYVVSQSEAAVDWVFEFHALVSKYTLDEAMSDLEAKCKDGEGKSCHAMLIAFCADSKSEACAWFNDKLVRVVVVFGDV